MDGGMTLSFLLGAALADAASHLLHRLQHCSFRLTDLHKRRHHTVYATQFYTKSNESWLPSHTDLDESVVLFLMPFALYAIGFETVVCVSNALALALTFYLHTAAHNKALYCPQWYRNRHKAHHANPSSNFSLLSPVFDCV